MPAGRGEGRPAGCPEIQRNLNGPQARGFEEQRPARPLPDPRDAVQPARRAPGIDGMMLSMAEDSSGRTPPDRPPLGLSPAVPKVLLILALSGVFVGLWPLTYWANRNADGRQRYYVEAVEISRVDLALRAVGIRRFAEKTGRLPDSPSECLDVTPGLQEWIAWADRLPYRDDWATHPDRISDRIEEPWSPRGMYYSLDAEGQPPVPDPLLDVFGLPVSYDHSDPFEPPDDAVLSTDPLPAGVIEFLESHGGVPAESPKPFSLSSATLAANRQVIRDARWKRLGAWGRLLGGIVLWIGAWVVVGRVWRTRQPGRAGRVALTVSSVLTGLAALLGLAATGATCYLPGRFSTRHLSREKRLEILDAAVDEGDVREDVAERARRYIRELP